MQQFLIQKHVIFWAAICIFNDNLHKISFKKILIREIWNLKKKDSKSFCWHEYEKPKKYMFGS
jgi:hypothetical protein